MQKALCFLGGMLLAASLLLCAVLIPAASTQRFCTALLDTVDAHSLGLSEADLSAFADETMRYLRGAKDTWEPQIPREGVSQAFRVHMAEVRRGALAAPWIIGGGIVLGAALLWMGRMDRKRALLGVLTLVGLLAVVLLWAVLDFDSFWMVLHRLFIPGGIFPAHEPVMRLFPVTLFMRYITPVCLWALGLIAALCAALTLKPKEAL